jgi:hypothetical protein
MPTLRSHTHLQATQANAQTKACKRVCLPNRTRTVQTRHDRPLTERRAATNSTFAIGGVSCSADSLVVAESFVLRINISGKNPAHRKSAKRFIQKIKQELTSKTK